MGHENVGSSVSAGVGARCSPRHNPNSFLNFHVMLVRELSGRLSVSIDRIHGVKHQHSGVLLHQHVTKRPEVQADADASPAHSVAG